MLVRAFFKGIFRNDSPGNLDQGRTPNLLENIVDLGVWIYRFLGTTALTETPAVRIQAIADPVTQEQGSNLTVPVAEVTAPNSSEERLAALEQRIKELQVDRSLQHNSKYPKGDSNQIEIGIVKNASNIINTHP